MNKIYFILLFLGIFSLPNFLLSVDKATTFEDLPPEVQFIVIEKLIDKYFDKSITTKAELYNVIKKIKDNLKIDKLFQYFAQSSLITRYLKNKIKKTGKFKNLSIIDIYLLLHTKGAQEILNKSCESNDEFYNKAGSLLIKKIQQDVVIKDFTQDFSKNPNSKLLKDIEFLIDSCRGLKNFRDLFKYTPLMIATINNRADIVELLINKGSDVKAKNSPNKTALDYAKDNSKIAKILLAAEKKSNK